MTFAALMLAQLLAQPTEPRDGDRVFATTKCALRATPSERGAVVRGLLAGDELVVAPQADPDEFHAARPVVGWLALSTIDGPSGRLFAGFLPTTAVRSEPPDDKARAATLKGAIEEDLSALETRRAPFAKLKAQALREPGSARGLALYMENEITPRAMNVEDRLAELALIDPDAAAALNPRFDRLAQVFRP